MTMTPSLKTNQTFKFVVVGTSYIKGAYLQCISAESGIPLELRSEPDNEYDKDAIGVYLDDMKIGYVPNQGFSCSNCWAPMDPKTYACKECGEHEHIVERGLATRLTNLKVLESKHGCVITEIKEKQKSAPLSVTLVTAMDPTFSSLNEE